MILNTSNITNDGSEDVHVDFQMLLNQLGEAYENNPNEECVLEITRGEYAFTKPANDHIILRWPPGVEIRGNGNPVLKMNVGDSLENSIRTSRLLAVLTSGAKRKIEGVHFNGGYHPANGRHAPTGPVEHQGLIFIGAEHPGHEVPETEVEIKECHFEEVGGDGVTLHSCPTPLTITDCTSQWCYRSAVAVTGIGTGDKEVLIENFQANPQLIELSSGASFVTDALDAESDDVESEIQLKVLESSFGNVQFDYGKTSKASFINVDTPYFNRDNNFSFLIGGRSNDVFVELLNCSGPGGFRCPAAMFQLEIQGGKYRYIHIQPGTQYRIPNEESYCRISKTQVTGATTHIELDESYSITTNRYFLKEHPYPTIIVEKCDLKYPIYLFCAHLDLNFQRSFWAYIFGRIFRRGRGIADVKVYGGVPFIPVHIKERVRSPFGGVSRYTKNYTRPGSYRY